MKAKVITAVTAGSIAAVMTLTAGISSVAASAYAAAGASYTAAATPAATAAPTAASEPAPVSGGTSAADSKNLEAALILAKSRVKIPAALDKVKFAKSASRGQDTYNVTWYNDRYSLTVGVSGDVIVSLGYNYYSGNETDRKHFGALSLSELTARADKYISGFDPGVRGEIKVDTDGAYLSVSENRATLRLNRVENGVKVSGNAGSITLDKNTGDIISFDISWTDKLSFNADTAKKAITSEAAKAAYIKSVQLKNYYSVDIDYTSGKKTVSLLTTPVDNVRIDGVSGKVSDFVVDYHTSGGNVNPDGAYAGAFGENRGSEDAKVALTPEEQQAVAKENSLLSLFEAEKIARADKYAAIPADAVLNNSVLSEDRYNSSPYQWVLVYGHKGEDDAISVSVDAADGRVLSLSRGYHIAYNNLTKEKYTANIAKTAEVLKHYLGTRAGEFKLNDEKPVDGKYFASYAYSRYVNGIVVNSDYAHLDFDEAGNLIRFNYTYNDVAFPDASVLPKDTLLGAYLKAADFKLNYYLNTVKSPYQASLIYTVPTFILNAKTGKPAYNGGVSHTKYTDIDANAIKPVADKLLQYGITLFAGDSDKLDPDTVITQADFVALAGRLKNNYNLLRAYETAAPGKAGAGKPVTKQEAVKIIITALGGGEFAEAGTYGASFNDVAVSGGYNGYFSLAKALGIVKADSNGNANPTAYVTRGQALQMVYDYLSR
ncbi:hypothetical protein FACS1894133_6790 [Clostridia bacterium]|nr:hypothetical protein FACS1894133_6790 [Clostridia bacterium]